MRNVWMLISGLAAVVAIGGSVYYFFPRQPAELAVMSPDVREWPFTDSRVLVVPAGNPLLTASRGHFDRWVPSYPMRCGKILFENADPKAKHFEFCIREIRDRVAHYTDRQLSREDVLDPRVKVHWKEVMGER